MKKSYAITYSCATVIPALAACLASIFYLHAPVTADIVLALCAASYGWVASRIALHLVDHDNTPKTWQLNIYVILISASWTAAVFSANEIVISASLALMVGSGIMFVGVRFDDKDDNGVPDTLEKAVGSVHGFFQKVKTKTTGENVTDLKYKPVDDVLGNPEDTNRPMCVVDGQAMSINEAIEAGREAEAQEAITYLKEITKESNE